ncbi:homocysteine-responsive endoplasmic reticulum-resident ubiquitin-like domain member 1 protein [Drosophila grimshawi]|uniref:GH11381 n=1 Tax=Drosophila grimshawi TaxID=7222 RepID=B4JA32_DROGR|nr:homocysteine-responsive endoplasmic reticulum-resident ubiquitin-like domain member 1 protein [Drosophila grimshawi]EDW03706.1 GH11381 [Drosophila grimshawi]
MDDTTTATTPSPSSAATAAGYDAASDKTNAASSNSSISLLIKSSNQQYDDIKIESDLCWTVHRLKKLLSLVYPGKPEIADQKLIYSGKLLDDAQKLSEVIRSYKDVYQQHHIFHLVCANKNVSKAPLKMTTPAMDMATTARLDTNASYNNNELRQRHGAAVGASSAQIPYQQQNVPLSQLQPNTMYPWIQLRPAPPPTASRATHMAFQREQQQALMYNAWMQQWYAGYLQEMMQRTSGTDNTTPPPMLHPLLQSLPMIPNNLSVPLVGQPPVATAAAAAAAGAGAVAGQANEAAVVQQPEGRQVDAPNFPNIQHEEPELRDWLESLFSFTRLAFFVMVLYFNSSPMRCVLVVLIVSVIYLYHIGVLRRRRERNNNNINRNNNAGNDIVAFAAVQQIQRMMDAAIEHDNNPQAAAEPVPAAAPADADQAAVAPPAAAVPPAAAAAPASAGANETDAAVAAAETVAVEPANANNSVISIVRTFVVTFFTSLLPEAPAL